MTSSDDVGRLPAWFWDVPYVGARYPGAVPRGTLQEGKLPVGPGRVAHLCKEVGRPAVWPLDEFAARPRYRVLVGMKRVA